MSMPPSPYDDIVIPFTEDELRQDDAETKEFTLAEIMTELENQRKDHAVESTEGAATN